jgi:phage virion morphogenesis protein
MDISIQVDTSPVDALLNQLRDRLDDMTQPMAEIGETIVNSVRMNFRESRAPDGTPWMPSQRVLRLGGQTLVKGKNLLGSIDYTPSPRAVEVHAGGTATPYAAVHQFGATIKPKSGKALMFKGFDGKPVLLRSVTIPARPYMGIRDEDWPEIEDILTRWLTK